MIKAQEFLIGVVQDSNDSYDIVEDKSTVSKSTVSRMMNGKVVSSGSMRLIADAYGVLDEFLGLVTVSADPSRAADELHERFEHSERILTEAYEDRIRSLKAHIKTLQEDYAQLKILHERQLERMEATHDKERALDESHFDRERTAWDKALAANDDEIERLRKNNVRCVIGISIEAFLLGLALLVLLLR